MIGWVGPRLSAHVPAVLLTALRQRPTLVPVSTLSTLAARYAALDAHDLEWLHLLISDWQIIADLSFADLVLWLPDRDGHGYWGGAQVRPTTGPKNPGGVTPTMVKSARLMGSERPTTS